MQDIRRQINFQEQWAIHFFIFEALSAIDHKLNILIFIYIKSHSSFPELHIFNSMLYWDDSGILLT